MRSWLVPMMLLIGCYDDPVRHCPVVDCPSNMVCDNANGCAFKEQLEQCDDQPDGTACSYPGVANGECKDELCLPSGCGNGILTSGEVCDDGNTTNGDNCSADCRSLETCGNGIPDFAAGETCDCGTEPNQPGVPDSCKGLPNSAVDNGSPCRENCQLRRCGDGTLDQVEQCEGNNLDGKTCEDLGFYAGTLACSDFCTFDTAGCSGTCGDGELEASREQCDGDEFGALSCQSFGFQTGELACNAGCAVETSGCSGRCGDEIKNGTEQCDTLDVGGAQCTDVGFYGGQLGCSSSCSFDTSQCEGTCGDGDKNGPEQCDGTDLDGTDCTDAGFYGGTLACNAICGFNTAGCAGRCGDGTVNGPEQCDGNTSLGLANKSCVDFGFDGGTLKCNANCGFDTSGCTGFCGDGTVNDDEQCDADNFAGQTCQTLGFYTGELACTGGCILFTGACDEFCGDGEKNGPEPCDKDDLGTATCSSLGDGVFVGDATALVCDPRCEKIITERCPRVDDGKCDTAQGETCMNSIKDCKGDVIFCCGNGLCSPAESPESCPADCTKPQ